MAEGGITYAIHNALRPQRVASEAIKVLWIEEGSIVVCLELDLPHALALLDLHARADKWLSKLHIRSVVAAEQRHSRHAVAPTADQLAAFRPDIRAIVFAADHFAALGLEPSPAPEEAVVRRVRVIVPVLPGAVEPDAGAEEEHRYHQMRPVGDNFGRRQERRENQLAKSQRARGRHERGVDGGRAVLLPEVRDDRQGHECHHRDALHHDAHCNTVGEVIPSGST